MQEAYNILKIFHGCNFLALELKTLAFIHSSARCKTQCQCSLFSFVKNVFLNINIRQADANNHLFLWPLVSILQTSLWKIGKEPWCDSCQCEGRWSIRWTKRGDDLSTLRLGTNKTSQTVLFCRAFQVQWKLWVCNPTASRPFFFFNYYFECANLTRLPTCFKVIP